MVWLPDGEKSSKISLFVLTQLTNVTDRRTQHADIYRTYAYASRGKNRLIFREVINTSRVSCFFFDSQCTSSQCVMRVAARDVMMPMI